MSVEGSLSARERPGAALRVEPWSRADLPLGGCVCGSHRVQRTQLPQAKLTPRRRALRQCPQWIFLPVGSGLASEGIFRTRDKNHAAEKNFACVHVSPHVLDTNSSERRSPDLGESADYDDFWPQGHSCDPKDRFRMFCLFLSFCL